jgi:hypothetical protein
MFHVKPRNSLGPLACVGGELVFVQVEQILFVLGVLRIHALELLIINKSSGGNGNAVSHAQRGKPGQSSATVWQMGSARPALALSKAVAASVTNAAVKAVRSWIVAQFTLQYRRTQKTDA